MISTGLQKLDEILSGGIPNGVIVDIFGGNGTGKTQLLLQLAINSIKHGGNVLYLDTTGGFRPERILQIQKQSEINFDILQKITVSRIRNTSEQIKLIKNLDNADYSLIVIDNVTDLFSFEYQKRELVFEKNQLFMKYMYDLSKFAIKKQIPIILTNMIRNIEEKEAENMQSAVDKFTHIKIHLSKKKSKFQGNIYWALDQNYFSYQIHQFGLSDQDI